MLKKALPEDHRQARDEKSSWLAPTSITALMTLGVGAFVGYSQFRKNRLDYFEKRFAAYRKIMQLADQYEAAISQRSSVDIVKEDFHQAKLEVCFLFGPDVQARCLELQSALLLYSTMSANYLDNIWDDYGSLKKAEYEHRKAATAAAHSKYALAEACGEYLTLWSYRRRLWLKMRAMWNRTEYGRYSIEIWLRERWPKVKKGAAGARARLSAWREAARRLWLPPRQ
ncbi:hypothetical protein [Teichococcus deserti]|uniref:hypothetical protein n=1 Tax=Teichococcus deserti TaxID=1817963 RepID=UPI001A968D06|nr:hypothetical protein [Pseudoroseomonas deserti]